MYIEQLLQRLRGGLEIANALLPGILHGLEELMVLVIRLLIYTLGAWALIAALLRLRR